MITCTCKDGITFSAAGYLMCPYCAAQTMNLTVIRDKNDANLVCLAPGFGGKRNCGCEDEHPRILTCVGLCFKHYMQKYGPTQMTIDKRDGALMQWSEDIKIADRIVSVRDPADSTLAYALGSSYVVGFAGGVNRVGHEVYEVIDAKVYIFATLIAYKGDVYMPVAVELSKENKMAIYPSYLSLSRISNSVMRLIAEQNIHFRTEVIE